MSETDSVTVGTGVPEENDEVWDQDEEGDWDEDAAEPQIQVTKSMYLDPEAEENEGSMAEEMARWSATLNLGPVIIGRATIFAFDDARNTDIWLPCDTHSDDLGRLAGAITGVGGLPRNRLFGYPLHEARNVAFVDRLIIDPDHRRQGLGRAFLWRTIETIFAAQPAVIAAYPFPIEARNAPGSEPWDLVSPFGRRRASFTSTRASTWRPTFGTRAGRSTPNRTRSSRGGDGAFAAQLRKLMPTTRTRRRMSIRD